MINTSNYHKGRQWTINGILKDTYLRETALVSCKLRNYPLSFKHSKFSYRYPKHSSDNGILVLEETTSYSFPAKELISNIQKLVESAAKTAGVVYEGDIYVTHEKEKIVWKITAADGESFLHPISTSPYNN